MLAGNASRSSSGFRPGAAHYGPRALLHRDHRFEWTRAERTVVSVPGHVSTIPGKAFSRGFALRPVSASVPNSAGTARRVLLLDVGDFRVRSSRRPTCRCRARQPGPAAPARLSHKRSLALREYALGLEALDRVARGEPLWHVHECVFAVLALESEPVDPRL